MFDYFTINNLLQFIKIILDISLVWVAFYFILKIVKNNSRTIQIFKGILLIFLIRYLASVFGLTAVEYLANLFVQYGAIAIIIIFQPEIRALLEKIGKTNVFSRISTLTLNERERLVDELVKACSEMSKTKTGALISLEQGHSLNDYIKTGTPMNSVVTSELLCSIFVPGTPLHDGAVILQGVKIACAAAYFPPTTQDLPTMYGARHRAAVGISEITDSITIIVSEETGNISIAEGGKLNVVSEKSLRDFLTMVICQTQTEVGKEKISKDSDLEKDIDALEKEKDVAEAKPNMISNLFRGKNKKEKTSGEKKKYTKAKKETAADKKAKAQKEIKRVDQKVEKIGIANLVEESMPLDNLFESIVQDTENKKGEEALKPKKQVKSSLAKAKEESKEETKKNKALSSTATIANKKRIQEPVLEKEPVKEEKAPIKKNENKEKSVIKRTHTKTKSMSDDVASLMDDVISPEAIVLNYKSDDKEKTSSFDDKNEGSDH